MQQSTPLPKQPSSHPTQFRTFDRRTDEVAKTRHAVASTAANCGSIPKVFDVIIDRGFYLGLIGDTADIHSFSSTVFSASEVACF